jgi:hypothetical protein
MENSHEPGVGDPDAVQGGGTPTARLRTGAKTLEQLTIPSARRVLRPTGQGQAPNLGQGRGEPSGDQEELFGPGYICKRSRLLPSTVEFSYIP